MRKWFENALLWVLNEIAPPIRLLVRGQLRYLLFVVTLVALSWALGSVVQTRLQLYLDVLVENNQLSPKNLWRASLLCDSVAWVIAFPLIVVAAALPVRLLFMQGTVTVPQTLKGLPGALRLSIQSTFWAFRSLIIVAALPALGIYAIYTVTLQSTTSVLARDAFFVSALALIASIIYRGVPVLCSPLLSVVGGYEPKYAVYYSQQILAEVRHRLIMLILLGAALGYCIYSYSPSLFITEAALCLLGWFFFTLLAHQLVVAAYEHQTRGRPEVV